MAGRTINDCLSVSPSLRLSVSPSLRLSVSPSLRLSVSLSLCPLSSLLILLTQEILEAEERFEGVLPERRADAEQHRRYQPSGDCFEGLLSCWPMGIFPGVHDPAGAAETQR